MTQRERNLGLLVGALFVGIVGYWGYSSWTNAVAKKNTQIAGAKTKLAELEAKDLYAQGVLKLRKSWQSKALPAKSNGAQNMYQAWITEAGEAAKVKGLDIDGKSPGGQRNVYDQMTYHVSGGGTLEQISKFLHGLAALDRMQEVRMLSLKPKEKTGELEFTMNFDTLLLYGSTQKELATAPAKKLEGLSADDLVKGIAKRNLFAAYKPPPPIPTNTAPRDPGPPPSPAFDNRAFTKLTGIIMVDSRPQAWVRVMTQDKKFDLFEGDTFEIDKQKGAVTKINFETKQVEFQFGDKKLNVKLGETLAEPSRPRLGSL